MIPNKYEANNQKKTNSHTELDKVRNSLIKL